MSRNVPAIPALTDKEFAATGLQRGAAIDHDLAYLSERYGVPIPEAKPDGPGHTYARWAGTWRGGGCAADSNRKWPPVAPPSHR